MPRPRTFDQDQVLEDAIQVFREQGYQGTSVPALVERLGICRQSLYTTFGDKRGLYLAALDRWGCREIDGKLALLEGDGNPLDAVRTVIRGLAGLALQCPADGCLTARAILEFNGDTEALSLLESQVARLEDGFRDALEQAAAQGELRADARPQRLARALITGCYGIGVLSRLPSSAERIADSVSVLLDMLDDAAR